jgi:gas vesicle protein
MSKGGSNLFAFLAGAAAGTIAGILYAPDTGVNTRDKLSYRLGKYKEMLEDLLKDIADGEDLGLSVARSDGEKVVNSAKEKAEQLLTDVDALLGQIQKKEEKPKK